jgi:Fe-S cluster assembly scaffold protein SufB
VQAGHAARVERVSEEKLFYLLSRWVDKKNATTLLLESMVGSLFGRMKHISETLYEDVKLDILMGVSSSHRSEE